MMKKTHIGIVLGAIAITAGAATFSATKEEKKAPDFVRASYLESAKSKVSPASQAIIDSFIIDKKIPDNLTRKQLDQIIPHIDDALWRGRFERLRRHLPE